MANRKKNPQRKLEKEKVQDEEVCSNPIDCAKFVFDYINVF